MRTLFVAALIAIALLASVLGIAAYRVNDYLRDHQADFAAQASAAVGRPVSFDTIGIAARTGISITLTNLRIGDDPRFGSDDLLRAESVSVSIDLLRAVFGDLRIREIVVEAPIISIIRTADGFNVDAPGLPLAAARIPSTVAGPPSIPATAAPAPGPRRALFVPGVATALIRNGTLRLIDRRAEPATSVTVTALNGSVRDVSASTPMTFAVRAALFGAATPNLSAHGTLSLQPAASQVLDVEVDGIAIDELKRLPDLAARIPASLSSPGPIHAALHLDGNRDRMAVDLRADATEAAVRYGADLDKPAGVALSLAMQALLNTNPPALNVRDLRTSLGPVQARVAGTLTGGDPLSVDASLTLPRTSLGDLEHVLPGLAGRGVEGTVAVDLHAAGALTATGVAALDGRIDLQGFAAGSPNLPGRINGLSAAIVFSGDSATLAPTAVSIGNAPAQLACRAAPLADPTLSCSLSADALPLHALGVDAADDDVVQGLAAEATMQPLDAERVVRTTIVASGGRIHGMSFANLQAAAHVRRGEYVLDSASLASFDGTVRASGTYRVPADTPPAFELRASASGVRVGPLLASQRVAGSERIDGRLDGSAALTGSGRELSDVRASLAGTGRGSIANGVLRGVDLGSGALNDLISARFRRQHPDLFGGALRFDQMALTFRIAHQAVATDDARLRSRDVNVDAGGTMAFSGGLNVHGTLVLSPSLTGDLFGGSSAARYVTNAAGGLDLPFTLRGTVERPQLRVSTALVADAVGRGVEDLIGGGSKGGKRAGDLIKEGLDKLFNR